MATLIQIRRDTQANWLLNDPVLALGEMAYSTDQQKLKVGNGSSVWSELSYINSLPSEITAEISAAIDAVVDAAPGTLDTLNELAAAINDDASFYTTITNSISSSINALDTDDIEEGTTNLYFTNQRALDATSAAYDAAGSAATAESNANSYTDGRETAITTAYQSYADTAEADAISTAAADATSKANAAESSANSFTTTSINALDTDAIEEGTTNLYFTDQRAIDAVSGGDFNTDVVEEGTSNLYFTDQRALDATSSAYDVIGSAATAESNANNYTDGREAAITTAYQSYADTAEADAISTAAADATSKANAAQSAAEATASADATSKANAAESNAEAYADSLIGDVTVDGTGGNTVTDRIASAVAGLVDSAPAALDTLNELAAALGDDANFATTVATDIGTKVSKSGDTMTGDLTLAQDPTSNLHAATKQYVDTAESDAVTSANSYTDGRETAITTAYQSYADTAEADAVSTASADATSKANTAESNANTYTDNAINSLDTDDIEEGTTNLYYTDARVESVISASSTDDLSEGTTNLYFTNQRAIDAVVENIAIADLSDVASTAPNDGELLMYSSSSSSWAPVAVIDGGMP